MCSIESISISSASCIALRSVRGSENISTPSFCQWHKPDIPVGSPTRHPDTAPQRAIRCCSAVMGLLWLGLRGLKVDHVTNPHGCDLDRLLYRVWSPPFVRFDFVPQFLQFLLNHRIPFVG